MVKIGLKPQVPPEHQPDATINVNNPVSGTKYEWEYPPGTPLGTQKNVRIISIALKCTWTVQPTPLEVHVTIDGVPITSAKTDPDSDTYYFPVIVEDGVSMYVGTTKEAARRAFLLEGRNIKIEAEITEGIVSNLFARVKWARWP